VYNVASEYVVGLLLFAHLSPSLSCSLSESTLRFMQNAVRSPPPPSPYINFPYVMENRDEKLQSTGLPDMTEEGAR